MSDKVIEEILKALSVACVTGGIWWIGKAIHTYADSKVKSQAIARDINHIRNTLDGLSLTVATMDEKQDDFGARLHEIEKKIVETDTKLNFGLNSGFHANARN